MEDIIRLIDKNNLIENDLKLKIIECVKMLVLKYPICYKNLCSNLESIKIGYVNSENKDKISSIKATSIYDSKNNEMLLNKDIVSSERYKNLLMHELLHVASFHDDQLGFENTSIGYGVSLNEGMTELLTREILNSHDYGIAVYNNDVNNILAIKKIIDENKLVYSYFNGGLLDLLNQYICSVGSDNIKDIITYMDLDHKKRVIDFDFNNKYKDKYIPLLINDLSRLKLDTEKQVVDTVTFITSYIRSQYQADKVPINIKHAIENSINVILSNYTNKKGKTL